VETIKASQTPFWQRFQESLAGLFATNEPETIISISDTKPENNTESELEVPAVPVAELPQEADSATLEQQKLQEKISELEAALAQLSKEPAAKVIELETENSNQLAPKNKAEEVLFKLQQMTQTT